MLGEDPPVLVQPRVKQGPAKVLIEESADADLLVVGTRGHGGFRGLVLGSVSQHVAAYAHCPVPWSADVRRVPTAKQAAHAARTRVM